MLKRLLPVAVIGFIFVLASYTLISGRSVQTRTDAVHSSRAIEKSKYPDIELSTLTEQTDKYILSIHLPKTKSEKINKEINNWIESQKAAYLKAVKNGEATGEDIQYELNIKVDTHQITDDIYSLILDAYAFTGGANGESTLKIFNFNIKTEQFLSINDILRSEAFNTFKLQELVHQEIIQLPDVHPYVDYDLLTEELSQPEELKWSINNDGLSLYFAKYEIAAGAAGNVIIQLPFSKLTDLLQDRVYSEFQDLEKVKENKKKENQVVPIKEKKRTLKADGKYVALTFDDGPNKTVTPKILKVLEQHDAIATFFVLGSQVDYYPDILIDVANAGHEIGNHSKSHPNLSNMTKAQITAQLDYTRKKVKATIGIEPKLIRPPYGAYNNGVLQYAKENNESIILWDVDSLDWKSRNSSKIKQQILQDVHPGSIILMHDIHEPTAQALPELLNILEKDGYEFVTVSEMMSWGALQGIGPHRGVIR